MGTRVFGRVVGVAFGGGLDSTCTIKVDGDEMPKVGESAQVLTGFFAAQGCLATDDHAALLAARDAVCAAITNQTKRPGTGDRQHRMVNILESIDRLLQAEA